MHTFFFQNCETIWSHSGAALENTPTETADNNSNSDLVREANERIRFSINFDARKFSNVKEDISQMKQDINDLKNDLKSAEQPLMVRQLLDN